MLVGFVQFGTYHHFPKFGEDRRRSTATSNTRPAHDADELALSLLYLVVQAAQNAFGGFRVVVLDEFESTPMVERKSRSL